MKKFISGMICGTVLFSTLSFANNIVAVLSQQKIMLDGNKADIMAYNIDGNNYFKLVDLAKEIGFNVKYNAKSNTVYINTKENYSEEITVTKEEISNECYIPTENTTIQLDDGTNYTFTDMSRYDKSMFASGSVGELPTPTCDWNQFPKLEIPEIEMRRFTNDNGDYLFVSNLKETKRLIYTLYNAAGENSEVWENGKLKKSSKGNDLVKVKIGITDDFGVQEFYPFYAERLVNVFESCPIGEYSFEAWDVYKNGVFLYTKYKIQVD